MKRVLVTMAAGLTWMAVVHGQQPHKPAPASPRALDLQPIVTEVPQFDVQQAPEGTRTLLKKIIVDVLPAEYEDADDWGSTKKVWDGLHMRMDGLQLRTKRKWKEANHGTWKKHRVTLVDPDQYLRAKVSNIQRKSLGELSFDLLLAARLDIYGRLQEWQRGIRLFSVSAEATADVEIEAQFTVQTKMDGQIPPGLIITPHADSAEIRLLDFQLHRISKAHGELVDELGDGLKRTVRKELAKQNDKVVLRINRRLEENADDLHLSVQDLIKNKWLGLNDL